MYIKVYNILAHNNPTQLANLVSLLDDSKSLFFIHIDKKVAIEPFKKVLTTSQCHFIAKREKCYWGNISLVNAYLTSLQEIERYISLHYPKANYHVILLSGEDIPLQPRTYIHDFLEINQDRSYMHFWELPYKKWWNGGMFRFENLYVCKFTTHNIWNERISFVLRKIGWTSFFPVSRIRKKYPSFTFYGSSQWMILNRKTSVTLLTKNRTLQQLKSIFAYTLAPDELYVVNVLCNFCKEEALKIENYPTHLVKFDEFNPHPAYLTLDDVKKAFGTHYLFGRKVKCTEEDTLLDFLKKQVAI